MNTLSYKTISANEATVNKNWVLVDAQNEPLGRLASKVASLIRGKHKTNFTPHVDCGDNVIVINAEKVIVTGKKATDKIYMRYTGFPGGQRTRSFNELMAKKPIAPIEKAVRGMLPKGKLGDDLFRNLYAIVGTEHKHEAQKPIKLELNEIK